MILLAVETSGIPGSIALSRDQELLEEKTLESTGRRHAQTLVAEIDALLKRHQILPPEIDVVAVSTGPGSFTGLRVGVTFAKTFAWLNDAALVAVETSAVIASQAPEDLQIVRVIMDALRGECFASVYRINSDGHWIPEEPIAIASLESLPTDIALTGAGIEKLPEAQCPLYHRTDPATWTPRAASVAGVGWKLAHSGQFSDPAQLEPTYVRRSYA
ncbi:MAG: tRNA (adenosine(37)-N6)-threonylcarbamoyltransferase complex dimerization subunit type 1 TsaB, partial [Planctomycetaceae bacterium]|nr:tRNA (adenosine(37)-N6)-threonylcarbamoyltransferase complex dimerization subunit type 1 TsaB [Planctomycetaceae bacterium]